MDVNINQICFENENARLLIERVIDRYTNFNISTEITEEIAMTMYLYATSGKYYIDKFNHAYVPRLNLEVS